MDGDQLGDGPDSNRRRLLARIAGGGGSGAGVGGGFDRSGCSLGGSSRNLPPSMLGRGMGGMHSGVGSGVGGILGSGSCSGLGLVC